MSEVSGHRSPRACHLSPACGARHHFCETTNEASIMVISLSFCLFVSAVFVHAGKVLTAQYFLWYLALLPLAWPAIFTVSKISPKALQSFAQQPEEISSEGDKTQRRPQKVAKPATTSASRSEREMQSRKVIIEAMSKIRYQLYHHRYYHLGAFCFCGSHQ